MILYQIYLGKFLLDYFIKSIIGKFLSIDMLSDQKSWKIIEIIVFLMILLGLRLTTLGVGVLKFQHLQHFKASNSEISFQFISDDTLTD